MFSTRLRVVLIGVAVLLLGLLARAVQVQWGQHAHWVEEVENRGRDVELIDSSRGRILDYKGRELALDAPCIDAVVDYRAITRPPNAAWVKDFARERLRRKLGSDYAQAPREQQQQLIDQQIPQVEQDLADMWQMLGDQKLTGQTHEQVEERRQQIVLKLQMQNRYIQYTKFIFAEKLQEEKEFKWWQRWLTDGSLGEANLDSFDVTAKEELRPHVILPAVSTELANYLGKNADRFPGLSLRPGQHRVYPYGDLACHVIGNLAPVSAEDVKGDPESSNWLRKYWPNDQIGRQGIEALCESTLRGTSGRWLRDAGQDKIDAAPQPGGDVRLSIDIELQRKAQAAFISRKLPTGEIDTSPLHGAAIVIDVATGQVRALVSYPTYDLNTITQQYAALVKDEINTPLINRATMSQLEPGSTVKPLVGMAGISEKVVGLHEGIECDGHLKLNGITYMQYGRCWSIRVVGGGAHHSTGSPHRGIFGNRDGFLTYADALERSCNVWPETVADRLGMERLQKWYGLFGLGRVTGIGLPESPGRLPRSLKGSVTPRSATWFAGIGQGIGATPIQMANVAATIARDGTWMRPTLVVSGFELPTTMPTAAKVKLPIDPLAVAEAKLGMKNVVNAPGGTGNATLRKDMEVAGKTGSAQAVKFSVFVRDEKGQVIKENGRAKRRYFEPSQPNPEVPWYHGTGLDGTELSHAWYMGFAPADKPQIAFVVMVEYGGSGNKAAGPIASALLEAAIEEGYLSTPR